MNREVIEEILRDELKRSGQRWGKDYASMPDSKRIELAKELAWRRRLAEAMQSHYARKQRSKDDEPYQGDPEVMATLGTLSKDVGGGNHVKRGHKYLS